VSPRAPHYFLHGNLVFGNGPDDAWAAYRLDGESYPGLSLSRKLELKDRLSAFAYNVESNFQLIRVARSWDGDRYLERALTTLDPRRGHRDGFRAMIRRHRALLSTRRVLRPEIYLFIRLESPVAVAAVAERLFDLRRRVERAVGLRDARGIGRRELAELRRAEARCLQRVLDYLPCERARSGEVAYLIRSAYTRGLGEPRVDANWRPQALWVEDAGGGSDEARFEPYEHDLLRLHESRLTVRTRSLRIDSDVGTSHQAALVVGALPDESRFPGPDVELLFAPLELEFPVDAVFTAEFVPNPAAQRLAQKRMVDADQQAKEEGHGEHGPTVKTSEKTYAARELQARLGASDRPPFLRSAMTVCVGARTEEELEERVDRLRAEFGRVELHRPLGEQHRLFLAAMPAQPFPVTDYKAHLLPEQFGAMVPTAISHAGSEIGPYIGHSLTGSRTPVLLDLAEASILNRPPTVLLTGSLGSGKTIALETLVYHAFLQGSTPIVDIDPKGDHKLDRLPGVAESMEVIELGGDDRYRGLLDPMRVAGDDAREDLTYAYLTGILPDPVPAEWQTRIRGAIAAVAHDDARSTGEVVAALRLGDGIAAEVAEALEVHLQAGLARLGYATRESDVPAVGASQLVSLRIRNLVRAQPGMRRSELQEDERISQAIVRLLAAYALRLCAADERVHSVLALDEAWALLSDSQGRAMLDRLSRMGRSMRITPILASQVVGDAEELEPLIGSYFAFGVEREPEAEHALALLRLDPDDEEARQRLLAFRGGRCFYLDHRGRTLPMRFEPGAQLLDALDTTPTCQGSAPSPGSDAAASDGAERDVSLA
jgi:AAA-like domain